MTLAPAGMHSTQHPLAKMCSPCSILNLVESGFGHKNLFLSRWVLIYDMVVAGFCHSFSSNRLIVLITIWIKAHLDSENLLKVKQCYFFGYIYKHMQHEVLFLLVLLWRTRRDTMYCTYVLIHYYIPQLLDLVCGTVKYLYQ